MTAVEVDGLRKEYGDVVALDDLSLSIESGALFGLLGPNGSGKTTTIELLTGQRTPTSGSASVLGYDPATEPIALRRAVGILPEREDPPSFLTPREYLTFVCEVRELADVEDRIDRWARRLEFGSILDTLAADLSEGERQRVMLAQAFVHEPDLLFIDEPLVNLDPMTQETVKEMLVEYAEAGNTLVLSTHFMAIAAELCTEVGILVDGRLASLTDPADLCEGELLATFEAAAAGAEAGPGATPGATPPSDGEGEAGATPDGGRPRSARDGAGAGDRP